MLVSIIVTNYNYGKFIHRCLRSCINQSIHESSYEIIVVDDRSKDDSVKIIDEYKEFLPNLVFIKNKKNLGVARSANLAIKKSRAKYIVRVDSDDYVNTEFLSILSCYMSEHPSILGVSCDYYLIGENKNKTKIMSSKDNPISCGIMYDRKKLLKLGLYNSSFRHREEEELRQRHGKKYDIHNLNFPLYRYQLHKKNKTKSKDYKKKFNNKIYNIRFKKNKSATDKIKSLLRNVIAIIPARSGSKRLKNKNMYSVWGKPMIYWTIFEAKKSSYINKIFVSSDSNKILSFAKKHNVQIIKRPSDLSGDKTIKMDAINHAIKSISTKTKPSLVVSLQANSPTITKNDIDRCIEHLLKNDNNEVISVNKDFNQNGAIRVMKYPYNFQKNLSVHMGIVVTDITDIHSKKDLKGIIK